MSASNPIQPIKSIRPITPTATSMPSKSVAPMGSVAPKTPISTMTSLRDSYFKSGLQPIGDQRRLKSGESRDTYRSTKVVENLPYAFMALGSQSIDGGKKFSGSSLSGYTDYASFYSSFSSAFGVGQRKTYQTADGPKLLYDYEYQNLMRYGSTTGPSTTSSFEFRDGRWWTVSKTRETYGKFVPANLDAGLSSYKLSAAEEEAVYQIAQKNRLTEAQYKNLYNTVFAQKYYLSAQADITKYEAILEKPEPQGVGYSASVRESSIFGPHSDLKTLATSMRDFSKLVNGLIAKTALDGSSAALFGPAAPFKYAASFLINMFAPMLWGTGEQKKKGLAGVFENITNLFEFAFTWQYKVIDFVTNYFRHKKKKYWLTNSKGKIIDSFADMDDAADRRDLAELAKSAGVSTDVAASYLGMYYRKRIIDKLVPALSTYDKMVSDGGYFSGLTVPEFYGRN